MAVRMGLIGDDLMGMDLFCWWICDRAYELADLVAHSLCCNACGCGLEVDMTCAADTGVEGVGAGHEGGHDWG